MRNRESIEQGRLSDGKRSMIEHSSHGAKSGDTQPSGESSDVDRVEEGIHERLGWGNKQQAGEKESPQMVLRALWGNQNLKEAPT